MKVEIYLKGGQVITLVDIENIKWTQSGNEFTKLEWTRTLPLDNTKPVLDVVDLSQIVAIVTTRPKKWYNFL